jgi:hypothetical protein
MLFPFSALTVSSSASLPGLPNVPASSIGRPIHGWEDNIKMYFREVGLNGTNWIVLAQVRDK